MINYSHLFETQYRVSMMNKSFAVSNYTNSMQDFWLCYRSNKNDTDLKYIMTCVLAASLALNYFD